MTRPKRAPSKPQDELDMKVRALREGFACPTEAYRAITADAASGYIMGALSRAEREIRAILDAVPAARRAAILAFVASSFDGIANLRTPPRHLSVVRGRGE